MQGERGISWRESGHVLTSPHSQINFHLLFYSAVSVNSSKQFLLTIQVELQDLSSVSWPASEAGLSRNKLYIVSIS